MKKIIAITSGEQGAGITSIALNLAITLNSAGKRTAFLDTSLGLTNVNTLLGIRPEMTLEDSLYRDESLQDALLEGPLEVTIIPGGSACKELASITMEECAEFASQFDLVSEFDYLIVDASTALSPESLPYVMAADIVAVIFNPGETSLARGMRVVRSLQDNAFTGELVVLPNKFTSSDTAKTGTKEIVEAINRLGGKATRSLPAVVRNRAITNAVIKQIPFMVTAPNTSVGASLRKIAEYFLNQEDSGSNAGDYLTKVWHIANEIEQDVEKNDGLATVASGGLPAVIEALSENEEVISEVEPLLPTMGVEEPSESEFDYEVEETFSTDMPETEPETRASVETSELELDVPDYVAEVISSGQFEPVDTSDEGELETGMVEDLSPAISFETSDTLEAEVEEESYSYEDSDIPLEAVDEPLRPEETYESEPPFGSGGLEADVDRSGAIDFITPEPGWLEPDDEEPESEAPEESYAKEEEEIEEDMIRPEVSSDEFDDEYEEEEYEEEMEPPAWVTWLKKKVLRK